jgi:hypothetical protein
MTDELIRAERVEVKTAAHHRAQIKRLEGVLDMYVGMPMQAMGILMQIANHQRALRTSGEK